MAKPDKVDTAEEATEAVHEAGYTDVSNLVQHGATWYCDALNAASEPVPTPHA
jgi:hypothetical protein